MLDRLAPIPQGPSVMPLKAELERKQREELKISVEYERMIKLFKDFLNRVIAAGRTQDLVTCEEGPPKKRILLGRNYTIRNITIGVGQLEYQYEQICKGDTREVIAEGNPVFRDTKASDFFDKFISNSASLEEAIAVVSKKYIPKLGKTTDETVEAVAQFLE